MWRVGTVVLLVCLASCATTKGPPPVFSARGAYDPTPPQPRGSLALKFYRVAEKAADPSADEQAESEKESAAMFEVGAALIYANCSDFFAEAGRNQTRLMVWKDAIGILGTLAAGIIALDGGSGTGDLDRLAIVTLGSSTALSGIDIYSRRYLFGAENVDAVRELTLNALSAHAKKVHEDPPRSYEAASRQLLDNQALCLPPRIAMLARDAIKNGNVVAYTDGTGPAPELAADNDRTVLADIGDKLGMAGPISRDQGLGYYWLTIVGASSKQQEDIIRPMLSDIQGKSNPFEIKGGSYVVKTDVPYKDFIRSRLARLSPKTISDFKREILNKTNGTPAAGTPMLDDKTSPRVKVDIM